MNVWAAVSAVLLIAICAMLLCAVGAVRGWIGGEPIVSRTVAEIPGAGEATVTEFGNRLVLEASLRGLDTAAVYLAGNSLVSDATAVIHDENGFFIGDGRLERVFAPKYAREYIDGIDAVCADKQKITEFYRGAGI